MPSVFIVVAALLARRYKSSYVKRPAGVTSASAVPRSRAWRSSTSPSDCAFQSISLGFAHPLPACQLLLDRGDLDCARALRIELDAAIDGTLGEAQRERRRFSDRCGDFCRRGIKVGDDARH